ncbi:MAG: multi-sensor signal transduction histidine kinase [Mongoliibacter sp.]|uniref:sensor histidine kinase n=1 Tax=Mongoliibacter sp. TaxID=2022438 RepID=UPI0012F35E77|nr:ATP-binding protein [Mongoliibacter sp.]TVP50399.1 MAG: multi-sensor signal transduction histidine kinase [Mongoliibacter sp.]
MKAELKIVLIYMIVGVLWILLSDKVLLLIFEPDELYQITYLQTLKGIFYVLMTALLLYLLVKKYYDALDKKVQELKHVNAELKEKSKELEASNKDLEQFAFVISHDLQEPLRMITGFLTQLRKKYEDQLDEKAQHYIFFAVDGAFKMKQIILDLLEFSRVGRYLEPLEQIDLNKILADVCTSNSRIIEETGTKISSIDLPVIYAHRDPITQLFQHLIGNALKYKSEKRSLEIEIGMKENGSFYEFWVKDNGIGINEEYADRIFVIFQRLHTAEKYGGGTGIGLALVKKIVEYYGGTIRFDSVEDKGSTFHFSLPKKTALSKVKAA